MLEKYLQQWDEFVLFCVSPLLGQAKERRPYFLIRLIINSNITAPAVAVMIAPPNPPAVIPIDQIHGHL
jgi:hypothetical protein